jgi:hypothetical protein
MINNIQNSAKSRYKYLFVLPLVLALYLVAGLANAKQSKLKDYKEDNQKPIKLTAAQLTGFAGKYQYMDTYVTVTIADGGIILKQLQGQRTTISFYPTNLREFSTRHFGKPYWIMFSGTGKGKAPSFVTIDHEIWVRVK